MDNDYDFEWDIKSSNGLNVTENKLLASMKKIGLNPEYQYLISKMTVDFAFLDERVVIEINGPYHETEEQKVRDKKRYFVLKNKGWKLKTFSARKVYYFSDEVAETIANLLNHNYDLRNIPAVSDKYRYENYPDGYTHEPYVVHEVPVKLKTYNAYEKNKVSIKFKTHNGEKSKSASTIIIVLLIFFGLTNLSFGLPGLIILGLAAFMIWKRENFPHNYS